MFSSSTGLSSSARFAVILGVTFLVCVSPVDTHSLPIYSSSNCKGSPNLADYWSAGTKSVNVYVESDFGYELRACTPTTNDDSTMRAWHPQAVIKASMEAWNLYSRGTPFVFKGTFSGNDTTSVCSNSSIEKPAILVEFDKGCHKNAAGDACASNSVGRGGFAQKLEHVSGCADTARLIIYGDGDGDQSSSPTDIDDCDSTNNYGWDLGANGTSGADFKAIVTHEFGHMLGFGHTTATSSSIMKEGGNANSDFRHLYPYDKDCADESHLNQGRQVEYHWSVQDPSSGIWSGISTNYTDTTRGLLSGAFRDSSGDLQYGAYYDDELWRAEVNSGGTVIYSYNQHALPTDISNLDVTPFLFTAWEFATGDDARLGYLFHGTSTSNLEDPPLAEYSRSDDYFATTATHTYAWCDSWSGTTCNQHFDIATHVPLVSA